jgi:hypothetical protein
MIHIAIRASLQNIGTRNLSVQPQILPPISDLELSWRRSVDLRIRLCQFLIEGFWNGPWMFCFRLNTQNHQSSSIDSHPAFASLVSTPLTSSSDSLLSSPTPTSLSLISPSTGETRDANVLLTAGFVEVS